jgi:hypothetical protein
MPTRVAASRIQAFTNRTAIPAFAILATLTLFAACERAPARQAPTPAPPAAAATSVAIARSDFAATLPAGQPITIDNPYGDVHVRFGGFEHKVDGHVVLQEPKGAAHIVLTPSVVDGRYTVAPRLPANSILHDGQRLDMSVFVPEDHDLRVTTEQGLIDVRGVHGNVEIVTVAGDITLRGIKGAVQAQTRDGTIEASLDGAPRGAKQHLATTTGQMQVGVDDRLDAAVEMATSAQFATDYSIQVERRTGQEPNKVARTVIGENHSTLALDSRRGEIRLLRRAGFTNVGDTAAADTEKQEDNDSD